MLARFSIRFPGLVVALSALLALVCGHFTLRLYGNLKPDLYQLLPVHARSVVDLDETAKRLESIDSLAVVSLSQNPEGNRRFVEALVKRLNQAPKEIISSVEYRITDELDFFRHRRALYIDLADIQGVRDYVRARLDYEETVRNPLTIFAEQYTAEPKFDFEALESKYEKRVSGYAHLPNGHYATLDGTKRAVLVYIPGKASEIDAARRLKNYVDGAIRELNPVSFAQDLSIHFTGSVENLIEEHDAIVADLGRSTTAVGLLVSLVMILYFRSLFCTVALWLSAVFGTIVTFAITYFVIGYLNANSAFLGSIVLGNGANFGIILLARYREERRKGVNSRFSALRASTTTLPGTLVASLAAASSYGALMLTDYRGFQQFGAIGLIGMVCCWLSAYTLLPALLILLDRSPDVPVKAKPALEHTPSRSGKFRVLAPAMLMLSVIFTVAAVLSWQRYSPEVIEADLTQMRSKTSFREGSGYYARYLDEIFRHYLTPTVILPKNRKQAREIGAQLKEKMALEGAQSLIASVQTLDDFLPARQAEKIRVLEEIDKLLPQRMLRELSPKERRLAEELMHQASLRVSSKTLPALIKRKFTETNGAIGNLILVEPPIGDALKSRFNLLRFVSDLRAIADKTAPGTPVAGTLPISADTIESISNEGPKATALSFLCVSLIVFALFRTLKGSVHIIAALLIGITWLTGLLLGFGIKINFLNFIAFPITFGIGVDYGVNIYQRYRLEGRGQIFKAVRTTGSAVALCTTMTVIGYSSLLFAENQAFFSFGLLAIMGELTSSVATLLVLPALLYLQDRRWVEEAPAHNRPSKAA